MPKQKPTLMPTKGLTGMRDIAEALNISIDKVSRSYTSAIRKLKKQPEAFSILLDGIHAAEALRPGPMHCASVECNKEYIELYAEDDRG